MNFPPEALRIPREKTVCFSGHRSRSLPDGILLRMVLSILYEEIRESAEEGFTHFLSGVCEGIDLAAAEAVLDLKRQHRGLKLICASPFPDFGGSFPAEAQRRQRAVLQAADAVVQVSPAYHPGVFRVRNQYMVSHSAKLIAVVTDYSSGTGQTIRMAQKDGLSVRVLSLASAVIT